MNSKAFLFRKTGLRLEKPGNHLAAVFIQNEIDNLSIIQYDMMNLGAGFPRFNSGLYLWDPQASSRSPSSPSAFHADSNIDTLNIH